MSCFLQLLFYHDSLYFYLFLNFLLWIKVPDKGIFPWWGLKLWRGLLHAEDRVCWCEGLFDKLYIWGVLSELVVFICCKRISLSLVLFVTTVITCTLHCVSFVVHLLWSFLHSLLTLSCCFRNYVHIKLMLQQCCAMVSLYLNLKPFKNMLIFFLLVKNNMSDSPFYYF